MIRTSDARDYYQRGTARLVQGDCGGALSDLDLVLEADPDYPEAYNNRGAARQALGDGAGAIADFDRALKIAPSYAEAHNNRGAVRRAFGDLEGAVADFDRALEIHPGYAEAYQNRGASRFTLGRFTAAIADFDQLIRLEPLSAVGHASRAAAHLSKGDNAAALADYDRVIGLVPRQAAALAFHGRGSARHFLLDFSGALADHNQAIEIDPNLAAAYVSRGNARYHLRDLPGVEDYWIAYRLDPRFTIREIIRTLAVDLRLDPEKVLENCRKHIRIHSEDIVATIRRGLSLLLLGRDAEAEPDLAKVFARKPEYSEQFHQLIEEARRRRTSNPAPAG